MTPFFSRQTGGREGAVSPRTLELGGRWTAILLAVTVILVMLAGWHREIVSRHPISDLPFVDSKRLERQIESGNVGRTKALFYRRIHAGADTSEVR